MSTPFPKLPAVPPSTLNGDLPGPGNIARLEPAGIQPQRNAQPDSKDTPNPPVSEGGKADLIACLRSQLSQAEARLERWEQLGSLMRTTNPESWRVIDIERREEVEQFQMLIEWAQNE